MSQEPERIAKFLARAGVASRREIERMIDAGRITLNGEVLKTPAIKVTDADNIIVDNKPAPTKQPPRFWRYYKPLGLVSTERDEKGRKTIFDDLPEDMPRTMSVGRLDINSEGLLLLTNDGGIKRKLELPVTGWLRRYRVRVNGRPTDETFEPLRQGVVIDREVFAPMEVVLDRQQGANAWLTVGLREGKYREVRRAMEHVGMKVNRLIRISYGPFQLGDMTPGEVRSIPTRVFKEQLGPEGADLFETLVDDSEKPKRTLKPRPNKTRGTRNAPRNDAGGKKPNKKRR